MMKMILNKDFSNYKNKKEMKDLLLHQLVHIDHIQKIL